MAVSNMPYYGTIPGIQQAFQNDPRTKLAQSAIALGTSTAPVAQGGWAVTDGLARAAQAISGAVLNKATEKKYGEREAAYVKGVADAAKLAGAPQTAANPAAVDPAMTAAAGALGGPVGAPAMPPQAAPQPSMPPSAPTGAPSSNLGASQMPSQVAPIPTTQIPPSQVAPPGQPPNPMGGGTGPNRGARADRLTRRMGWTPSVLDGGDNPQKAVDNKIAAISRAAGYDPDTPLTKEQVRALPINLNEGGVGSLADRNNNPGNIRSRKGTYMKYATKEDGIAAQQALLGRFYDRGQRSIRDIVAGKPSGAATQSVESSNTGITTPQMETVPNLPNASTVRPVAPDLPPEIQNNRIPMAQALMASGNPDLMEIAQKYLDQGLDEQNDARKLANQEKFQQGQTGYSADLADWQNDRSSSRDAQIQEHRDAQDRNFKREQTNTDQTFQAGQAQIGREYGTSERKATQAFEEQQRISTEGFEASQADLNRKNSLEVAGIRSDKQGKRNAYFSTPTGLKMQQKAGEDIDANNQAISKYTRFMALNEKQGTGGVALNTPGIAAAYRFTNSDLTEMNALSNDTTLAKIGGSLGTAISDGDRKFITDSNIGASNPRTANNNIARATIGALKRKNDYIVSFANAQADGTSDTFVRDWAKFAETHPVVHYDAQGKAVGFNKEMTFSEWRASRPRYNAQGKKIN